MHKLIPIEKLYTHRFGEGVPIKESTIYKAVKEIYDNPDIEDNKCLYYDILSGLLTKHGEVWGWIRSEEDKIKRVQDVKELAKSLKENGYKKELESVAEIGGYLYGDLSVQRNGDDYIIFDGHHRMSIMVAMGDKFIRARICE